MNYELESVKYIMESGISVWLEECMSNYYWKSEVQLKENISKL